MRESCVGDGLLLTDEAFARSLPGPSTIRNRSFRRKLWALRKSGILSASWKIGKLARTVLVPPPPHGTSRHAVENQSGKHSLCCILYSPMTGMDPITTYSPRQESQESHVVGPSLQFSIYPFVKMTGPFRKAASLDGNVNTTLRCAQYAIESVTYHA